jgi:hypothetical protein
MIPNNAVSLAALPHKTQLQSLFHRQIEIVYLLSSKKMFIGEFSMPARKS